MKRNRAYPKPIPAPGPEGETLAKMLIYCHSKYGYGNWADKAKVALTVDQLLNICEKISGIAPDLITGKSSLSGLRAIQRCFLATINYYTHSNNYFSALKSIHRHFFTVHKACDHVISVLKSDFGTRSERNLIVAVFVECERKSRRVTESYLYHSDLESKKALSESKRLMSETNKLMHRLLHPLEYINNQEDITPENCCSYCSYKKSCYFSLLIGEPLFCPKADPSVDHEEPLKYISEARLKELSVAWQS
jgi:hypothetical protein